MQKQNVKYNSFFICLYLFIMAYSTIWHSWMDISFYQLQPNSTSL